MAFLVPREESVALRALVKRGGEGRLGESLYGPLVCVSLRHIHTHMHTLTQEHVEDPSGHPAGAEG